MKNIINKSVAKTIYIPTMTLVGMLIFSYIIFIYKTVILASNADITTKNIALLSANINQKDFDYLSDISDIDLNTASSLGYQKNTDDRVAYVSINDNNNELARR